MEELFGERPDYLSRQLLTYIGNKRALLGFIGKAVDRIRRRLAKDRLTIVDLFSGSGVVSRYFKQFAAHLLANDLEPYSEVTNRCYLTNESEIDLAALKELHTQLTTRLSHGPLQSGIIARNYAPQDDSAIKRGERVFYTTRNALYLDTARLLINEVPEELRHFFIAPLLSEASVHANTSGVFKGFYKDARTGFGKFGGSAGNALTRILGEINLPFPVFSRFDCPVRVRRQDANELVRELSEFDLAYIDPPYNQHPYGSNYFMLNLLADYQEPEEISRISGIPINWRRSNYNKPRRAAETLRDLVANTNARYLLVSFNSEGFLDTEQMTSILQKIGTVEVLETRYNTFRGSRNLRNRSAHVTEYLYLVERA